MIDTKRPPQAEDKSPMPKDSFVDDLLWVTTETLSPAADPKEDPMPGEEKKA